MDASPPRLSLKAEAALRGALAPLAHGRQLVEVARQDELQREKWTWRCTASYDQQKHHHGKDLQPAMQPAREAHTHWTNRNANPSPSS